MLERLWELERLVNRVVWGPGAMGLILGAGLVVSALCGFPQVFRAGTALRVTARRLLKGKSGPGLFIMQIKLQDTLVIFNH